jgi:O-acetyl-ADP-ribose deacetylase (regulator of RNase III)
LLSEADKVSDGLVLDSATLFSNSRDKMQRQLSWKNKSVLSFALNGDPIEMMEAVAQQKVFEAVGQGWSGPPFDPLELARIMGIHVRPNASIPDARIFELGDDTVIEFNPNRAPGRVNFSIAHELAHTFFSDWREKVRNRAQTSEDNQNWQLEMLCNIGAAEILMPLGSFPQSEAIAESIEGVMQLRKKFEVSAEAILIRLAKLSKVPMLAFAASRVQVDGKLKYRIDYSIPSSSWEIGRIDGLMLDHSDAFAQSVAIGTTANARERWSEKLSDIFVHAVGLPPYPGSSDIRVAGFIKPATDSTDHYSAEIEYRHGDASIAFRETNIAILHIVNDKAHRWGGRGFANALYKSSPDAAKNFAHWARENSNLRLGTFHVFEKNNGQFVISIVAQQGYGQSAQPRIRYSELASALRDISSLLQERGVQFVQMPRIGAGQAGGNWSVIEGIIFEELVLRGIDVKIFDLPPR